MTNKEYIEKWLTENCTVSTGQGCAEGTGLLRLHQKAFRHTKHIAKAEAVGDLAEFYADTQNIRQIWDGGMEGFISAEGLNENEKAFVTMIVQYNGREFKPASKKIATELGLAFKQENQRYYSMRDRFESNYNYGQYYLVFLHLLKQYYPKTKAVLLFPGGRVMPYFVLEALRTIIPPFEYKYSDFEPSKNDRCVCRENRIADFSGVIGFASREALKAKPGTFDITKAKLLKMVENIGFDEVCELNGCFCSPKEASRINDFKVALPMLVLSANVGLIDIDGAGFVTPGRKAVEMSSYPSHILAKKLFDSYMESKRIYETHYITYISVRDGEQWVDWEECRRPVIELLKTCPVGKWIKFEEFDGYMSIFHGNFFRKLLSGTVFIKGYDFGYGYYGNIHLDWNACDSQIIRLILTFLGTIGMLDVAYTEKTVRFRDIPDDFCVGISSFRITPLGAWILGLTDSYKTMDSFNPQSAEGGLLVLPDHTVVISGLKSRIEHESYLSVFLTRLSAEDNVSIYQIDFPSMVRAFNHNIQPKEIEDYLKKASAQPLSENVLKSFSSWQSRVGRVKIRTVTLLETDDPLLLKELIHTKGINKLLGDEIENAVIIPDEKDKKRIKSIAEKNGWLVEASQKRR